LVAHRELFTVCALAKSLDEAVSRLQIVDTCPQGITAEVSVTRRFSVADKLQKFRLEEARCYNPNDETKIRAAIERGPGGSPGFVKQIRDIGRHLGITCTKAKRRRSMDRDSVTSMLANL
jgi:rRNA maturation protein Nop10